MPNIYVTDETKEILEKVAELDHRTQDGEIHFLLQKRLKDFSAPSEVEQNHTAKGQ